jgi:ATP-dependent Clp protease adaptor protein ClpS
MLPPRHEELGEVATEIESDVRPPSRWKVLLHNDDYTTMEFVVWILEQVFHRSEGEAIAIMLQVHQQGLGVAGVYTHEVAEMKVAQVENLARASEYPLLCTMEEEED